MNKILYLIVFVFFIFFETSSQVIDSSSFYQEKKQRIKYSVSFFDKDQIKEKSFVYLTFTGEKWTHPIQKKVIENYWEIEWSFIDSKTKKEYKEKTSIVINSKKIFLHPIRLFQYKILEFCPFPIVEYPLQKGKKWTWTLNNIPYFHAKDVFNCDDKEAPKSVDFTYSIEGTTFWMDTKNNQKIECYIISATGNCKMLQSKLTAYFSNKYGFVYLKYDFSNKKNINGSYLFELNRNILSDMLPQLLPDRGIVL